MGTHALLAKGTKVIIHKPGDVFHNVVGVVYDHPEQGGYRIEVDGEFIAPYAAKYVILYIPFDVGKAESAPAVSTWTAAELAAYSEDNPYPPHRPGATADDTLASYQFENAALKKQLELYRRFYELTVSVDAQYQALEILRGDVNDTELEAWAEYSNLLEDIHSLRKETFNAEADS